MSITGMRHMDEAVSDLFDRLDKRVTPVPAILAKTFRSLNTFEEQVKEGSSDARNCYWYGSIVTFGKWKRSPIGFSQKTTPY
ncbi:hypothetical protein Gotur_034660 [Gossypium turneri]